MPLTSIARRLPMLLLGVLAAFYAVKFAQESRGLAAVPWGRFAMPCVVVAALSLGNYLLRFARWHWLLRQLGHRPPAGRSLLAYFAGFALTVSPGKAGELIRARYYAPLGVPPRAVGACFVAERLVDVAAVAFLCLLALEVIEALASPAVLAGAAVLFVAGAAAGLHGLRRVLRGGLADPAGAGSWLGRLAAGGAAALQDCVALLAPRIAVPALLVGVLAWALEGLGLWLLVRAVAPDALGWMPAVALYAVSLLAGAFSFVPGGLGGTEAVLLLGLDRVGIHVDLAITITVLCRLLTLWLAVALGWAAALALGWRRDGRDSP